MHDLMQARRAVKEAKALNDSEQLRNARSKVDAAKVALDERGPVSWNDAARTTTTGRQSICPMLTGGSSCATFSHYVSTSKSELFSVSESLRPRSREASQATILLLRHIAMSGDETSVTIPA